MIVWHVLCIYDFKEKLMMTLYVCCLLVAKEFYLDLEYEH
jgi:hypothetical protein